MLFCTSFFRNDSEWNTRYVRWLNHYQQLLPEDVRLLLIDDASPFTPDPAQIRCVDDCADISRIDDRQLIVRFPERLGRADVLVYPGWWRSFLHSVVIARSLGVRKIIHIESDAFVLSHRLLEYIQQLESGWITLWTEGYNMPETAIQVICEDQFEQMDAFRVRDRSEFEGKLAERLLPFTHVNKDFLGDRYGEFRIHLLRRGLLRSRKFNRLKFFQQDFFRARIPAKADFATQVTADQKIWFA
jgi:hypothetical protein